MSLIALKEETDSCTPIKWVDLGYEWTVNEVSIPGEGLSEIGISKREKGRISEVDDLCYACWRNEAEIEPDIDLVFEKNDVFIGFDLQLYGWVSGWEEENDGLLDEFLYSQFRKLFIQEVDYKLDDGFT